MRDRLRALAYLLDEELRVLQRAKSHMEYELVAHSKQTMSVDAFVVVLQYVIMQRPRYLARAHAAATIPSVPLSILGLCFSRRLARLLLCQSMCDWTPT